MSSNPIDNIDGAYIVSEVALLRTAEPAKVCLLVEGPDDEVVYKRFVNTVYCWVIPCYGKENLIPAIDKLNQQQVIRGYLAIKDADFDVVNNLSSKPNLLLTDGHDLEVMICTSEALDKFVEVRLRGKSNALIDAVKQETRSKLFEVSAVLGYLRWLSLKYAWGIDIQTFRILACKNQDFELSLEDSILKVKELHGHIDEAKCDPAEFIVLKTHHLRHLCHGHELMFVLRELFPQMTKKHLKKPITPGGEITDVLFMAYEFVMFKNTTLYAGMNSWERQNPPFKIFSN